MRPYQIAWLVCGIFLVLFVGFKVVTTPSLEKEANLPVAGAQLGGAFELIDQDGKTVTEKSWPDKYLLIYFGFTHCPDICPLGLTKISDALSQLPEEKRNKIQPMLITVDPERDTAQELKTYVALFNDKLIGLTGSNEQIDHVKGLYRVYAEKEGRGKDYMVNHSGYTYLMAPNNTLATIFAHETSSDEMAKEIKKYVR